MRYGYCVALNHQGNVVACSEINGINYLIIEPTFRNWYHCKVFKTDGPVEIGSHCDSADELNKMLNESQAAMKRENEADTESKDLSSRQLDAFSSLVSVLLSMVSERDLKEMDATDLRTGESIPAKKFIADNYAIVTNGKRTIKFKGESE